MLCLAFEITRVRKSQWPCVLERVRGCTPIQLRIVCDGIREAHVIISVCEEELSRLEGRQRLVVFAFHSHVNCQYTGYVSCSKRCTCAEWLLKIAALV